jgi:hypothetical protein
MKILKLINALPIIAIGMLGWYSLQAPKTSRETLSIPQSQSATIQIPNGEPDPDAAASLPEYEVVPGSIHDGDTLRVRLPNGQILKIRFSCMDAPELKQLLGEKSRDYLRSMINELAAKLRCRLLVPINMGDRSLNCGQNRVYCNLAWLRPGWRLLTINIAKIALTGMLLNQVRNRRWSLSEVSGDRLTLSGPGIIANLIVSLGSKLLRHSLNKYTTLFVRLRWTNLFTLLCCWILLGKPTSRNKLSHQNTFDYVKK